MNRKKKLIIVAYYLMMSQAVLIYKNRKRSSRRCWARKILLQRERFGDGENLCRELQLNDNETFFNYSRMSVEQFEMLFAMVGPGLSKFSIRKPISERNRLLLTLRFLATGESYVSMGYAFRVCKSTVYNIIKETSELIWEKLNNEYIPKPSLEHLKNIAAIFYKTTGMPNCIGAIDGKHCVIQSPPMSGTLYFNYKKTFSVVLLAVCDCDYNFTYVNVGGYGSESDGGVLKRSDWGHKLLMNQLELPADASLPDSDTVFPYYFVGDEAFPLKRHLLRPYGGRSLPADKVYFNENLSRARRYIENTFGILASKFRIYHTVICAQPELAQSIVKCTVVLHTFIRSTQLKNTARTATDNDSEPGRWIRNGQDGSNYATHEAQSSRDILKNYLMNIKNKNSE